MKSPMEAADYIFSRYPVRAYVEDIDAAVDKMIANDPNWWEEDQEVSKTTIREAFIAWLDQRIFDILDSPSDYVNDMWSGFDDHLRRIKRQHREKVARNEAVIATKTAYDEENRKYNELMSMQVSPDQPVWSTAQEVIWNRVVNARKAYLAAVESALTAKEDQQ